MNLEQKIEAVLFFKGEAIKVSALAKLLKEKEGEVITALERLETALDGRGLRLSRNGDEVLLVTHPDAHAMIEALRKEELEGDLSKAALETLTIILYKETITKSEIDYIRGVNSGFILRNLLIRGLIEKLPNPKDKRSPLYRPTFDTINYLGIASIKELPDYEIYKKKLEEIEGQFNEEEARIAEENKK